MADRSATRSTNSASVGSTAVQGRTEPRIFTAPLRDLGTAERPDYDATYGWDVIAFARDVLGRPLDLWQQWLVVHAGEMLPDGRPRFRQVLALVSRQNGKTELLKVLALYWLFVERQPTVLGMSTNLTTAKEAWRGAIALAQSSTWIAPEIATVKLANGDEALVTTADCRYKIAASNARGGRGLTIERLVVDELREHQTWDAYNAAIPAMNAVYNAQAWFITNQGEDKSIVLDALRGAAIEHIQHGNGDDRLGLFEWSAPDGADPEDLDALAMANPALGRRIDPTALIGMARRAKAAGGTELSGFRTEQMCQRVHHLDPAIEPDAWRDGAGDAAQLRDMLAANRRRVALCVDIALDGSHATVIACAVLDGRARAVVVGSWSGMGCSQSVRAELPQLVAALRPAVLGWFPNGPAASIAADLEKRKGRGDGWPPPGTKVEELRGELTAVCMGLAEQVRAGGIEHPADAMLDAHVAASSRAWRGDAWVFQRAGAGPIDGTYALAGALHLARTMRVIMPISGGVV